MKKTLLLLCLASASVFAQKRDIDNNDLIAGKTPQNFTQALPTINRWLDDDRVLITQKISPDGPLKTMILELKPQFLSRLRRYVPETCKYGTKKGLE